MVPEGSMQAFKGGRQIIFMNMCMFVCVHVHTDVWMQQNAVWKSARWAAFESRTFNRAMGTGTVWQMDKLAGD